MMSSSFRGWSVRSKFTYAIHLLTQIGLFGRCAVYQLNQIHRASFAVSILVRLEAQSRDAALLIAHAGT